MNKLPAIAVTMGIFLFAGCATIQRKLLFYPSHHAQTNGLAAWEESGKIIGFSRQVPAPKNIWLMIHGNGGQATDRAYAIPCFSAQDSVFILEYPGYGNREGLPSKSAFDAAAAAAYLLLRNTFPQTPVCIVGESIGSGPACTLANQLHPPDKIVLVVPFDTLKSVAADHLPFFPVGLILGESWDNIYSLSTYEGPVEIFAAEQDTVIPIIHAERLSAHVPSVKFHRISGNHNDWSKPTKVSIENS